MDLNYLLARHQVSLIASRTASCHDSRAAHIAFAHAYAGRIRELQQDLGARARLTICS